MKTGNSAPAAYDRHGARIRVRDDSQRQLRDIEELVAKLQVVTRQLEFPAGAHHGPRGTARHDEVPRSEGPDGEMN